MSIRIPLDTVQWGFFLIPNYKEGQSVIIVKGHLSFADVVGLGQFLMAIQYTYDPKSRPGLKTVPWYKIAAVYLLFPFLVLKAAATFFMSPRLTNSMKNVIPTTGRKSGAFSCDMDLSKI